jgi:uncharacterized protein (TIGR02246 family)
MPDDPADQPQRATDETEIRALHRRSLEGWNQGNGAAFAAPFSTDADFIAFDGSLLHGRAQIAQVHQELFDKWLKGSRLVVEQTTVRFLRDDVAVVLTVGACVMRGKSRPAPERDSIQTQVAVREPSGWSFVSFQNTRIRPIAAGPVSALLWLIPDKLWGLFFRATHTVPRASARLSNARSSSSGTDSELVATA